MKRWLGYMLTDSIVVCVISLMLAGDDWKTGFLIAMTIMAVGRAVQCFVQEQS